MIAFTWETYKSKDEGKSKERPRSNQKTRGIPRATNGNQRNIKRRARGYHSDSTTGKPMVGLGRTRGEDSPVFLLISMNRKGF
jgi:hypothetical protein